jgi:hypothetical protein
VSPRPSAAIIDVPDHDIVLRDEWLVPRPYGLDCRWTLRSEVKALCYYAKMCGGNIVEIGCNEGNTTVALAFNNPDKRIYAVDWLQSPSTMVPEQRQERPEVLAKHAQGFSNVEIIDTDSSDFAYDSKWNVRMVFIDGGHQYSQVKSDSEKAIDHLQRNAGGYVFWHDYASDRPNWVEVARYLEREIAPVHELFAIRDTGLALIRVEPIRQEREWVRSRIVALERDLAEADDAIRQLRAKLAHTQGELQHANERWDRLTRSWSWTLTRPVRAMGRVQRRMARLLQSRSMSSLRSSSDVIESSSQPLPELPADDPGLSPSSFRIWMRLRHIKARACARDVDP